MWRRTIHVETRNNRDLTPRLANAHLWRSLLAPAAVLLVAWPRLAANLFATRLHRADVHAPRDVLLVGAAAIFYARKLRPPDRALLRCDLVYAYLSHSIARATTSLFHGSFWPLEYPPSIKLARRPTLGLRRPPLAGESPRQARQLCRTYQATPSRRHLSAVRWRREGATRVSLAILRARRLASCRIPGRAGTP